MHLRLEAQGIEKSLNEQRLENTPTFDNTGGDACRFLITFLPRAKGMKVTPAILNLSDV